MKIPPDDWTRFDALTDAQVQQAALRDTDAPPLTDERIAAMRRIPRAKTLRRALA